MQRIRVETVGHDLSALYYWAQEFGLDPTGSRDYVLNVLGRNYEERMFAYPREAVLLIIMPWRLRQMAHELTLQFHLLCFVLWTESPL